MKIFFSNNQKNITRLVTGRALGERGFTLLEVMVAIAIFTIIMIVGISALLNVNNTNKKSQSLRTIMDNLNFAMEDMTRNFKLGSYYHCVNSEVLVLDQGQANDILALPQDCDATGHNGSLIASVEPMLGTPHDPAYPAGGPSNAEDQIVYWFDSLDNCQLKKSVDGGATFVSITPYPDVELNCAQSGFNIYNTDVGTYAISPRVIIRISGVVNYRGIITPFNLQTSASQRSVSIIAP